MLFIKRRRDAAHISSRQLGSIKTLLPDRFLTVAIRDNNRRDAAHISSRQFGGINTLLPDRFLTVAIKDNNRRDAAHISGRQFGGINTLLPVRFRELSCIIKKLKLFFISENEVFYINGSETLPPPLSKDEELEIMQRISNGDEKAREPLIVHNLRLVVYIAKKFETPNAGSEDLISIGTIGLIKAVKTFVPEKNIKLATYASRCIENEILMFLRKSSQLKNEVSIDEPLNTDWDGNELLLCDILGSEPDIVNRNIENELEKSLVLQAVSKLKDRECLIMELRFGLNGKKEHTQKQVADKLGISQSYISRLEKKIIRQLKSDLSVM